MSLGKNIISSSVINKSKYSEKFNKFLKMIENDVTYKPSSVKKNTGNHTKILKIIG